MNDTTRNTTPLSSSSDPLGALRDEWSRLSADLSDRFDAQTKAIEHLITTNSIKSLKDKLLHTTLMPNIAAVIGILVVQVFTKNHPWLMVASVLFFVLMALLRCFQAYKIKSLNPFTDTIRTTLEKIMELKRLNTLSIIIGVSLAVPLLVWMMTVTTTDYGRPALIGGIAGLVVGAPIGWLICRRRIKLINQLAEQLKDQ
ncbi:MAG: hypothetical protein K2K55_02675 [Duncaniella sp.]|nr:hypothetical protein [Duncaniella sp.]